MGGLLQAASVPTIQPTHKVRRSFFMSLLLLEAFGALVLLVLIVWWTMFSGRPGGELPPPPPDKDLPSAPEADHKEKTDTDPQP